MVNMDQRGPYTTTSAFQHVVPCGNFNVNQCRQSSDVFVDGSSLLQAAQDFSDNAGQRGQYNSAVGWPPPVCYATLPPDTGSHLIIVEAVPRGRSVYETSAIPQVASVHSGLPAGAAIGALLDSVTMQPHTSMHQNIAVAGLEVRTFAAPISPGPSGPQTALRRASKTRPLPACATSAVAVMRPVTALPGISDTPALPACARSTVAEIQPGTAPPGICESPKVPVQVKSAVAAGGVRRSALTSLQLPQHARITAAPAQPSALTPVSMPVSETGQPTTLSSAPLCEPAQPSVGRHLSGDLMDAAALDQVSNGAQRHVPWPCVTRGTVDAAAHDPPSNWAQHSVPSPCVTRGIVGAAAPDLLSS